MAKKRDGWEPGVRVIWDGHPGQIVKRSSMSFSHVWVKLDEEPDSCLVEVRELRQEGKE